MSYHSSVQAEVKHFLEAVGKKNNKSVPCCVAPNEGVNEGASMLVDLEECSETIPSYVDNNFEASNMSVDLVEYVGSNFELSDVSVAENANMSDEDPANWAFTNNVDSGANDIQYELATWFVENHTSQLAASKLLKILKKVIPDLPTDVRTLLKTPLDVEKYSVDSGEYIHYGVRDAITDLLVREISVNNNIYLNVGIDGLPLYKSSNQHAWPILINIHGTDTIVVAGVYVGGSKPKESDVFLKPFVEEMKILLTDGLYFNGVNFQIHLRAFICDAPARSFVLCVKSHSGYFCCTKCNQEGSRVENRIIFHLESDVPQRTDENFRDRSFVQHHHRSESIVLEQLPIDMVNAFPLDYMHVVCLGVVRTLLTYLVKVKKQPYSLKNTTISCLNTKFEYIRNQIPTEFNRRPRSLNELEFFKATEFRTFLLYTGPFVLQGCLDSDRYEHFLLLSIAIRLLLCPDSCKKHAKLADAMLRDFISRIPVLYSSKMLTYNFHCLTHLASDATKFSSLETVSAFKFENHMQKMKKSFRMSEHGATQIYRRLVEESIIAKSAPKPPTIVFRQIKDGFAKSVWYKKLYFSTDEKDSFYYVKGHETELFKISKIEVHNESCVMHSHLVLNLINLFELPMKFSLLHIFKSVSINFKSTITKHSLDKISGKIVHFYKDDLHVFFPLIH